MAAFIAGDRFKAPYAGDVGNAAVWSGYYKAPVALAINDTLDLFEVPAGAKVDEIVEAHSAFGASATFDLGWKYKDGSTSGAGTPSATAFRAVSTAAAAGNSVSANIPHLLFGAALVNGVPSNQIGVVDKPIIVYATIKGAAMPINGELYVKAGGEYIGTK